MEQQLGFDIFNGREVADHTGYSFETEGIKYAGSKREIIPSILKVAKALGAKKVCDAFSGTTRVSQAFSKANFTVHSNDISDWSRVMGTTYLLNKEPRSYYQPMIDYLNSLKGVSGWFTENYSGSGEFKNSDAADGKKKIWQTHNTIKLDAIRPEIDRIAKNEIEKSVLLASLIYAMDKVDSTVGHHVSYLREWAPRAYNTMLLEVPSLILNANNDRNRVTQLDVFDLLNQNTAKSDLYYFDPPYGSSNEKMPPSRVRYASYYHVWTTIIRNDKPILVGAANRREDVSDKVAGSVFEEFRRSSSGRFIAVEAIEKMLRSISSGYVVLSYSNQGRATLGELVEVCHDSSDDVFVVERTHKSNVMRTMRWTNQWTPNQETDTKEFLFVLSKSGKIPSLSKVQ